MNDALRVDVLDPGQDLAKDVEIAGEVDRVEALVGLGRRDSQNLSMNPKKNLGRDLH